MLRIFGARSVFRDGEAAVLQPQVSSIQSRQELLAADGLAQSLPDVLGKGTWKLDAGSYGPLCFDSVISSLRHLCSWSTRFCSFVDRSYWPPIGCRSLRRQWGSPPFRFQESKSSPDVLRETVKRKWHLTMIQDSKIYILLGQPSSGPQQVEQQSSLFLSLGYYRHLTTHRPESPLEFGLQSRRFGVKGCSNC